MRAVKICTAFGAALVLLWVLIACGSDADRVREMNEDSVTSTSLSAVVSAMDIQAGDCISSALSEGISIETVEIVPCSGAWQYRVVSLFDVADSELYPGVEFFAEQASENCGRGNSFWMYPGTESWELGDRTVVCLQEAPASRSSEDAPAVPDEETAEMVGELTTEEVYSRISPSIPLIETPTAIGSGILIEGGYVVTNYHVVWPFDAAWVVFPGGPELQDVPVVGWDPLADVAVLGPVDVSVRPLKLEDGENMSPGQRLVLGGLPCRDRPHSRRFHHAGRPVALPRVGAARDDLLPKRRGYRGGPERWSVGRRPRQGCRHLHVQLQRSRVHVGDIRG